jgi:serine/threonine-protein kinase HipA
MANNALDFKLAKSVGEYFQLNNSEMDEIISEVLAAVKSWREIAAYLGIARNEIELMARAFDVSVNA